MGSSSILYSGQGSEMKEIDMSTFSQTYQFIKKLIEFDNQNSSFSPHCEFSLYASIINERNTALDSNADLNIEGSHNMKNSDDS